MTTLISKKVLISIFICAVLAGIFYYQRVDADPPEATNLPLKSISSLSDIDLNTLSDVFSAKEGTIEKDGASTFYFTLSTSNSFEILAVRFEPKGSYGYRCGLVILSIHNIMQKLTTIGKGITEVLSCDGIVSMGIITSSDKHKHLGLIYDLRSPNVEFRSGIILSLDKKTQKWMVNEELINEKLSSQSADNMWNLDTLINTK